MHPRWVAATQILEPSSAALLWQEAGLEGRHGTHSQAHGYWMQVSHAAALPTAEQCLSLNSFYTETSFYDVGIASAVICEYSCSIQNKQKGVMV